MFWMTRPKRKLDDLIGGLKQRTGAEIAVVTVRNLGGATVEDFANQLFVKWGVGQKSKDDGVLLLAAIQDRKLRIEVGDGAEADITDGQTVQIIRSVISPRFKAGDYNGGLYNGTLAVAQKLDPSLAAAQPVAPTNNSVPGSIPDSPRGSSDSPFSLPNSSAPQTPFENPQPSYGLSFERRRRFGRAFDFVAGVGRRRRADLDVV